MKITLEEEGFRALLESDYVAAAIVDETWSIVEVSNGFMRKFALSSEWLLHHSLQELFLDASFDRVTKEHILSNKRKTKHLVSIEIGKNKTGWNIIEVSNIRYEEQRYYCVLFIDQTESYQMQSVLETLLITSGELFLILDSRYRILHCTEYAAKIFGFSGRTEAMGVHLSTFIYQKLSNEVVNQVFNAIRERKAYNKTIEMVLKGKREWYELQVLGVSIKEERIGTVLRFEHVIEPAEPRLEQRNQELNKTEQKEELLSFLHEETRWYSGEESYEGKVELLKEYILQYAYIEINRLIEELILITDEEGVGILQKVQNHVMEFDYDQAMEEVLKMGRGEA